VILAPVIYMVGYVATFGYIFNRCRNDLAMHGEEPELLDDTIAAAFGLLLGSAWMLVWIIAIIGYASGKILDRWDRRHR